MTFPSEQEHFDAVKAALTAAQARPYDYDDSPTEAAYTLLTVSDRFGGIPRATSQSGTRSARISVRAVGKTADNAREMRRRFDAALREQRITVGAFQSTPIAFETADAVGPDGDVLSTGGWYSALSTYTYTV